MDFVVMDVETGGTTPGRHSLLQVGLLAYRGGEIIDRKEINIQHKEYFVTPKAMEINGLDLVEVARTGVTPYVAISMITSFVKKNFGEDKPMLLGHNVNFDRSFIKELYLNSNVDIDSVFSYRVVDTSTIIHMAKVLGKMKPDAPSSLQKIADYLGLLKPSHKAHTALSDAELTLALYEKLISILKLEGSPWE
jgi:DNA polymerase-3 subunit epsilon